MPKDPIDPCSNVVEFLARAGVDAAAGLPYADQIFIGGRLLSVITFAARGLIELESAKPNRMRIDQLVADACEALQDVGAALRDRRVPPAAS